MPNPFTTGVSTLGGPDTLQAVPAIVSPPPFVPVTVQVIGLIRSPSASGVGAIGYLISVGAVPVPGPGTVLNDTNGTVDQRVRGLVSPAVDDARYFLTLEAIDSWRIGSVALTPPYTAYWKIIEHYSDGHEVIRKIRPLSTGGATQRVLDILV